MLNILQKISDKKLWLVLLFSSTLLACSTTDEEEELDTVAELTEIIEKFEPEIVWDTGAGDGIEHYFSRLKPHTAYGKIFAASRAGEAFAFDLATGDLIWEVDLSDIDNTRSFFEASKPALLSGGPIAGMNKVFIGSENGKLYALDAETGALSWEASVKGEIIAAPVFDSGIVVVNSASGKLKAFNASTGEDVWEVDLDVPPLTLRGISPPIIASGGVIVGTPNGNLNVYMLEKGQQGWTVQVGEPSGSTELERVIDVDSKPLVFGDKVYSISSRGNLVAVDIRNGRILWKRQYSSYRQLSLSGNTLFLTDVKGHVYAVDRINGLEKWSNLLLTNRSVTGPAAVGNYVVVGDVEGYLHWIEQDTGDIVARYEVDGSQIYSTPLVVDDILYVLSQDGELVAIKTP